MRLPGLCLSILVLLTPSAAQSQATSSLEGMVIAAGTNQPLARSRVVLTKIDGTLRDVLGATTDANGAFSIRNVPAGAYRLFAEHDAYVRAEYGARSAGKPGVPVVLVPGQLSRLSISMTATGGISGQVTNESGEPLRGYVAKAMKATYDKGERYLDRAAASAQSDDRGQFRIFGLAPGQYYLGVFPPAQPHIENRQYVAADKPVSPLGVISPSAFAPDSDWPLYYPSSIDDRHASPVDVKPAETFNAGILKLRRGIKIHVRGQIVDGGTGAPPVDVNIHLGDPLRTATLFGNPGNITIRAGDVPGGNRGAFDFPVSPGHYRIRATISEPYPYQDGNGGVSTGSIVAVEGATEFEVADRDIENLQIVMWRRAVVSGRVSVDGRPESDNDPDLARMSFFLEGGGSSFQRLEPSGRFNVTAGVTAGHYLVPMRSLPANWYVKSARAGGVDVMDGLRVAGVPVRDLQIVVSPNGGQLDTIVSDRAGKPLQGATVVLVPNPSYRKRFSLYRNAGSDASGKTHFEGIAPGVYKVFAWDSVEPDAWQYAPFMETQEHLGTSIEIRENDRGSVEVKVIP